MKIKICMPLSLDHLKVFRLTQVFVVVDVENIIYSLLYTIYYNSL